MRSHRKSKQVITLIQFNTKHVTYIDFQSSQGKKINKFFKSNLNQNNSFLVQEFIMDWKQEFHFNHMHMGTHYHSRTTDAQRGNSLHCTAENSIPIPNFQVWPKHILSATLAQSFRYFFIYAFIGCPQSVLLT